MVYRFCRFISKILCHSLFHLQVKGRKNVYKVGGAIYAVNHTSFADPIFAGVACSRKLYYLARRSLFQYKFLGFLLPKINVIPLNRDNPDAGTFKQVIKLLKNGKLMLIFPEGTRSPDGNFLPGQSGIGFIALKAKVPIIPVYIKGAYKAFPRHRSFILPAKIVVSIGEPIFLDTWFRKPHIEKSDYSEIANLVMNRIKQLKKR